VLLMCYRGAMTQTSTVHARIDKKTKEESERILRSIGMTPTEAVRLFYRQIALRKEFPLELRVPNQLTGETLTKSDRDDDVEYFGSIEDMAASWKDE